MSYDHTWVGLLLAADQVERVRAAFEEASRATTERPEPVAAIEAWRAHPERVEEDSTTLDGAAKNAFIWSFDLPAFDALDLYPVVVVALLSGLSGCSTPSGEVAARTPAPLACPTARAPNTVTVTSGTVPGP